MDDVVYLPATEIARAIRRKIISSEGGADGGAGIKKLLEESGTSESHLLTKRGIEMWANYEMSSAQLARLQIRVNEFRSSMLSFMEQYDPIICPTIPFPAPPNGVTRDAIMMEGTSYASAYNIVGWTCTVVRGCASTEGLAKWVQVVARPGGKTWPSTWKQYWADGTGPTCRRL